jgi:hypothetical protein
MAWRCNAPPGKVTVRYGGRVLIEQGISLSSRVNALFRLFVIT